MPNGRNPSEARGIRREIPIKNNLDLMAIGVNRLLVRSDTDDSSAQEGHAIVLRLPSVECIENLDSDVVTLVIQTKQLVFLGPKPMLSWIARSHRRPFHHSV